MGGRALPPSGDPGHSPEFAWTRPEIPYANADAARMGLDRNTLEGAQLHFFAQLDGTKPVHRMIAWFVLFVVVGMPTITVVVGWLHG